jgi:putative hydroxymethylpyrimidine transport system substrate-binding protein
MEPVIKRVQTLGVPDYEELVLVAREDLLEEEPEAIHSFMSAVARGTEAAVEDPDAAVEAIEETDEAGPESTPQTTRASVEATLPLLSTSGSMDTAQTDAFANWMHAKGLIPRELSSSELLTEDFLDGQ